MSHPTRPEAIEKPAAAAYPIDELISHRWSPRAYSERAVERHLLAQLFEAARWAPSSFNEQPWEFVITERGTEGWQRLFDTLVPFNQEWVRPAPVLVLGVARKNFSGNNAPNRHALYDLGQAVGGLLAEATALGLSVHQMAGFDADKARTALHIPESHEIGAVMTIGYAASAEMLPDAYRERELAPRQRHAIESFVYEGDFGKAAKFPAPPK